MLLLWTVFGFICLVGVMMQPSLKTASGCVAMANCSNLVSMSCSADRHIFILKAQYGHKSADSSCSTSPSCDDCCTPADSDCLSDLSVYQFSLLYGNSTCWKGTFCQPRVQQGQTVFGQSTFGVAHYSCLRGEDITDFHRNTTITAPAVAIHYDSSDNTSYPVDTDSHRTWHCQVDTEDSVQRQTDVILVREVHKDGGKSGTSSVGWSGGGLLEYARTFRYTSFNATTPFNLSVRVGYRRIPDGWSVVRTQDGSNLLVTCGYTDEEVTTTLSSPHTETPETSITTSSQGVIDGLGVTSPAPAAASVDVGAVVGGVVAVVVLLVAAVLAVFCFRRWKRGPEAGQKGPKNRKMSVCAPLTSRRPSMSPSGDYQAEHGDVHLGVPNPAFSTDKADVDGGGDYAVIEEPPQPQVHQAAAPDTHNKPSSPAENTDYDLLGQKKSQSSSSNPAATYGRLGEVGGGGEDTDYSYDHLASGRQAAPDVINSDYDTAALHVTSEGDYNVAGIPQKQHVITGSDYEVAQTVTSEGDYNRLDFQGKKQQVITGSDYDTAEIVTSEGDYNRVDFQERKQEVITGSAYDLAQV